MYVGIILKNLIITPTRGVYTADDGRKNPAGIPRLYIIIIIIIMGIYYDKLDPFFLQYLILHYF